MRCLTLVKWSELFTGIAADRLCGTALGMEDINQDGILELRITDVIDHRKGKTIEKYYEFDSTSQQYEILKQEPGLLGEH